MKTRLTNNAFALVSVMILIIFFHLTAYAAYIGSRIQDYQSDDGTITGVKVAVVDANGPGAKAGLREGDIILSVNGRALNSSASFAKTVQETPSGGSLYMTVLRKGERLNLALVLTEIPQYVVFHKAGIEHAEKNNHEEAINYFTKAIDLNPKYAEAYHRRGNVYMTRKQYDEAISDSTKGIELSPTSDGYHKRGRAYEGKKLYDFAISDYSKVIEMKPEFPLSSIIYTDRGFLFYQIGSFDRAIADFSSAIKIDPQNALAYDMRGHTYMMKREQKKAETDYETASKLYMEKGMEIAKKGDYDGGIRIFNMGIKLNTKYSSSLYYQRGLAYEKRGDHLSAVNDYSEAVRLDPGFSDAYQKRGNVYAQKLGDNEKANRDWEKAASLSREGKASPVKTSAARPSPALIIDRSLTDTSVKAAPEIAIEDVFLAADDKSNVRLTQPQRGERVKMVIKYTVSGIHDGVQVDAVEYRRISYGGEQLVETADERQLQSGTYETFRFLTLPEQTPSGDHVLDGVIMVGEKEIRKCFPFRLQ